MRVGKLLLPELSTEMEEENSYITWACQVPVAQACILAAREDCSSKLAQANSSQDPVSKKPITKKRDWWSGSRCKL
jgi:hypothetical protein